MAETEIRAEPAPATVRWRAAGTISAAAVTSPWPLPSMPRAIGRGMRGLCPVCARTRLFAGYLAVVPQCAVCGTPLGRARADDAPPYFTILVVGHVVVGGMLLLEKAAAPPLWVHAAIWLPLTIVLSLLLLRPIKGGTVGLMLKLGLMKDDDAKDGDAA